MNDARYLIASHCLVFAVVSFDASSYYARIDLICERMSLSRFLLKLLLSSSSNDGSQQALNLIRHLLSGLWGRSKISMKVSLLQLMTFPVDLENFRMTLTKFIKKRSMILLINNLITFVFALYRLMRSKWIVFEKWIFEEFAKNYSLFYHFVLIEWNES